jgi:protein TonB
MFNNLIESRSHRIEFKRRGSFFLFTTASYALLFLLAGVASIYAYDAKLEDQSLEVVVMMSPLDFPKVTAAPPVRSADTPRNNHNSGRQVIPERQVAMARVDQPTVQPKTISTTPNTVLPVPPGTFRVTGVDTPGLPGGPIGNGGADSGSTTLAPTVEIDSPPPAPTPIPAPRVYKSPTVLNSKALDLPVPPYPPMAKQMRIQGVVSVQVLLDETGKVISAKSVSGNPFLAPQAVQAAYRARFSPTTIGDHPVKVSGVITYNFVLR